MFETGDIIKWTSILNGVVYECIICDRPFLREDKAIAEITKIVNVPDSYDYNTAYRIWNVGEKFLIDIDNVQNAQLKNSITSFGKFINDIYEKEKMK